MKSWLVWVLLVGLLVAVALGWKYSNGGVPVEVVAVQIGAIREFVDERGQTRLPATTLITMPYEGRIQPITLEEGATVKAGDVVARIVPADLASRVAEATAAVDRLKASIVENREHAVERTGREQASKYVESMTQTVMAAEEQVKASHARRDFSERQFERQRSLRKTNAATEEQLNRAELELVESNVKYSQDTLILTALRSLLLATVLTPRLIDEYITRKDLHVKVLEQEQIEATARLEQVERNQKRGTMTSPVSGVVLKRNLRNEQVVAQGTVLLEIGELERMQVEAEILTQDAVRIKPGDPADLYGPTIGQAPVRATVERIYPAGFTKVSSLGVEQQRVMVILSIPPEQLKRLIDERQVGIGYRVSVRVFTAQRSGTLTIPRSAVFRASDGQWQVFAVEAGLARRRNVTLGLMNDEQVELLEGLKDGDEVVVSPEATLVDGSRVRGTRRVK